MNLSHRPTGYCGGCAAPLQLPDLPRTPPSATALARAFGCARRGVQRRAAPASAGTRGRRASTSRTRELSKLVITEAKATAERAWLGEVSAVVLQQALADLNTAYRNFFASITGKRKGRKVAPPRFRSRKDNRQADPVHQERPVQGPGRTAACGCRRSATWRCAGRGPCRPSRQSVTVIRDAAGRYFASFVVSTAEDEAAASESSPRSASTWASPTSRCSPTAGRSTAPKFLRRAARKLATAATGTVSQAEGLGQPREGRREGRQGARPGGRHPAGLAAQALHARSSATTKRCTWRICASSVSAGPGWPSPCTMPGWAQLRRHAGVQGQPVRAHVSPGGPVLPVHADVLGLRTRQRQDGAQRPSVGLPVRQCPRPGRQRG